MKSSEQILQRLFRAAMRPEEVIAMPFGFDTRVLVCLREVAPLGQAVIAILARRASAMALAIMLLVAAGVYGTISSENNDATNSAYGMVDTAIQSNLGE